MVFILVQVLLSYSPLVGQAIQSRYVTDLVDRASGLSWELLPASWWLPLSRTRSSGIPEWPLVKTSKLIVPLDRLTEKAMTHAPQRAKDQWVSFVTKWKGTQDHLPSYTSRQSASSTTAPATPTGPAEAVSRPLGAYPENVINDVPFHLSSS